MKKYYFTSAVLHIAIIIAALLASDLKLQEIFMEPPSGQSDMLENNAFDVQVIELSPEQGDEPKEEPKNFYWGLGISGEFKADGYEIHQIYRGYPAEAAGLLVNDIIAQVNGQDPWIHGISGDGPALLKLVILRNKILLTILVNRGKIYY